MRAVLPCPLFHVMCPATAGPASVQKASGFKPLTNLLVAVRIRPSG